MQIYNYKNLLIIKISYVLLFLIASVFVFFETKIGLHLEINSYHSGFFDLFFKYLTHLGDGIMFGALVVIFFFINKKASLVFAITGIATLLVTHFFKRIVFKGVPRPVELIGKDNLHLVEGVKMAHWNSFPSGHTIAAFAIATILIYRTRNFYLQFLYFGLAVLAGFSRVYLSQHFVEDILAGSALGIFTALVSMKVIDLFNKKRV